MTKARDERGRSNQVNSDKLQLVVGITGPMPTGVAVSRSGRIFINFPRWGDPVEFTVAELKDGQPAAFPDKQINKAEGDPARQLVSVQSVVVDDQDRLWILGGWFDSFSAPPRDVWSSADGKTWRQVTREAPWKHSDLPMTLGIVIMAAVAVILLNFLVDALYVVLDPRVRLAGSRA